MKKISILILLFSITYMLNAQLYSIPGRNPKFCNSGRFLAVISNNRPEIYGMKGEILKSFDGHKKLVMEQAFTRNGKILVTGDLSGVVMVWNLQEGVLPAKYKMPVKTLIHLAISNDGKYIAIGDRKAMFEEIFIFNLETKKPETRINDSFIGDFKFSPDGKYLVKMSNNDIKVWSTQTWTLEKTFISHNQPVTAFDFNSNGKLMASVALDKSLKIWDFESAILKSTFNAHKANITDVAFHPNGTLVATTGDDSYLNFWDIEANKQLYANDMKGFGRNISFGPEGTLIAISGGIGKYAKVKVYRTDELRGTPINDNALVIEQDESKKQNNQTGALPVILWKNPASVYVNSTTKVYKLSAIIKSTSKITETQIFVNDEEVGAARGFKPVETNYGIHDINVEMDITLANGSNVVKIVAKTAVGHTVGDTRMVNYNANDNQPVVTTGRKDYALLFAANTFDYWQSLVNPIPDAEAVASELKNTYGYVVEVVKNASTTEIMAKLREYAKKKYNTDDQLLIFFAGHGQYDEVFGEGYVVGRNSLLNDDSKTSYLPHSVLRTTINNIPSEHILLVMDVCFGGTFDPTLKGSSTRGGEEMYENVSRNEFIQRKLKYKTRKYLTSGGKEYVPDGRPGQHSPFTRKLLEAMRSNGGTDRVLTLPELIQFIDKVSPEPRFGEFGNNVPGSDFLFIAK